MKDLLHILLLAMIVCCWSCSGGEEEPIPTPTPKPESNKIEITTSAPVLEQKGGTATVSFTTNAAWTASVSTTTSWVSVSPSSGAAGTHTLTVTTAENDTYDERNATLTIKAGNASQNLTITQKQKDALTVTSNKVEIGSEGGTFSIEAKANVSVSYEIEEAAKEWISASESRGLTTKTLNFTAKANEKEKPRQGNIILKGSEGLTETITVYQEGEKPTLVITSEDIVVGSNGETIKIELKSNVDYEMILPEADWISKEESRAISAYTHYLTIATNETYDQRSAIIYFQNAAESLKDSICITQLQKDAILIAKNEYTIASEGGNLEFSVNTNVDFEVSVSVDWIKQNTESRSLVEKLLSFVIAENEDTEPREGEIVITYQDLKQTIKITQKGRIDYEAIDRAALIDFYKATDGDNWTNNENWCSDKPLKEWYGIKTNDKNRVTTINLFNLSNPDNLKGYIPESIGNLTALKELRLHFTQLSGQLPESIGKLTSLNILYLRAIDGKLTGALPESIGNLTALEVLNLCFNCKLSGPIPKCIGNLTALKTLYLFGTQFDGSIPESIGNLNQLLTLFFSGNQLTGSIPESIGKLSAIQYLDLGNNQLTGPIPEGIGNLSKLEMLNLGNNQLTGTIPESIGNLSAIQHLNLGYNKFSGSIPESIGKLSAIQYLDLGNNQLTGPIPEGIGNLSKLEMLNLGNNQLTGTIPESIGNLSAIQHLNLGYNKFSGSIPESIGNLTALEQLYLIDNQLTGNIPESLGNLTNLESMNFQWNSLSGKIPTSFTRLNAWRDCWQAIIIGNPELDLEGIYLPAPEFSVTDIQGNNIVSENEYNKNKMTILYNWGTWCPFSNEFNSTMLQLYNTYHKYGMEIIGSCVLLDSPMAVEETMSYLEENAIPWKNLIESSENQIGVFHVVPSIPAVIVVDDKKEIIFHSIFTNDYYKLAKVVEDYFASYTN